MSTDLKFKPLLAFVLRRLNSGSKTCWRAISCQSIDMSPTAAMTQLRSEKAASFFAADAARSEALDPAEFALSRGWTDGSEMDVDDA